MASGVKEYSNMPGHNGSQLGPVVVVRLTENWVLLGAV